MSIAITIVTTANRTRRFTQTDEACIQGVLDSLKRSGQLFSNRTLIIGSGEHTEIFSPSSITRIEIETERDLSGYLPAQGETQLSLIPAGSTTPPVEVSETAIATQLDFYFEGGDTVAIWISGPRPSSANDRLMQLTRLFDQPILMYRLEGGGVGFMNPATMTRALIASAVEVLPTGAWRLDPA